MHVEIKSTVEDPELVEQRRSQFVTSAIKLFCREGFHRTTVKDIARVAKVSPGLIYQYVTDKDDLLFLTLRHIVESNHLEIPAALDGVNDPILRLHAAVTAYVRVMDENREAVMLTYRESKSLTDVHKAALKAMELETNDLISSCIRDCIAVGYIKKCNVELLTYHLVIMSHGWALKHWRLAQITTLDEYLDTNIHSIWENLLSPKGIEHYKSVSKDISTPKRVKAKR